MKKLVGFFIFLVLISGFIYADFDFSKIKNNVSEFTLANGLKFILVENHSVPIATFLTYVNAGGADERDGIWGISHFLEHMAFKGTSEFGTTDVKAEKKLMAEMDILFDQILTEKKNLKPDQEKIKKMEKDLEALIEKANQYVIPNEFDTLLKENGATDINAMTSKDATRYYYSLPSNRLELWAYMESSRFTDPVFREFYKERGVIAEERRMRVENTPVGNLIEELQALAYKDHTYHISVVGPMSNIQSITRKDMYQYFKAHYTGQNIVIGVIGDIYPDQLKKMAEKYFSRITAGEKSRGTVSLEPKQTGEKTITVYDKSQPWLLVAYHCPALYHPDYIKFRLLDKLITSGRSSRLNKKMVIQEKTALGIFSLPGYPGDKYPSLYLMIALPNSGHTTDKLLEMFDQEIKDIQENSISEEELASAKIRLKIDRINQMDSNLNMIIHLLEAEVKMGSWKEAFAEVNNIDKITGKDIQELAKTYLVNSNRTVARIEKEEEVK